MSAVPSSTATAAAPVDELRRRQPLDVLRLYPAHDYSLAGYLASRVAVRGEHLFLLTDDGRQWTWAQFEVDARRLASALAALGVGRGDRVAIAARNDPAHALVLFAVGFLGAVMVSLNPEQRVEDLASLLARSSAKVVVADPDHHALAAEAAAGLPRRAALLSTVGDDAGAPVPGLPALIAGAPPFTSSAGGADDTCAVIFTSGSTGTPKGVMHSQRSYLMGGEVSVARTFMQPESRLMILLPLFHINSLFYSLGGTVAAGASALVAPRFSAGTFWNSVANAGVTQVNMTGTVVDILLTRPRAEYRPDHRLRTIIGGVREHNEQAVRDSFGIVHCLASYGMSEIPGVLGTPFEAPFLAATAGALGVHPDPSVAMAQCRLVDDQGRDVPAGDTGEMWVKTPIIMQGYMDEPQRTADSFTDGWFRTGDLMRCDAQGNYYFVARKKDIIRRRGENISGVEVDTAAMACPGVLEAAAIGVPDTLSGEEVLLAVVPRPGETVTARQLHDWCAGRLSRIKVPRYIAIVDELPHTGPFKIAKEKMRQDATLVQRAADMAQVTSNPG